MNTKQLYAECSEYLDWLNHSFGPNWVLARRTSRITAKYGENVNCISAETYKKAQRAFRLAHGAEHDAPRAAMYLALLGAEATLSMCAGRLPEYAEVRRKETIAMVRDAIKAEQATF
jgi:hypothetical protein